MKNNELPPSPPPPETPRELAELLGEGRMSVEDKENYIEAHKKKFRHNVDFVKTETYRTVFEELGLDGKKIINVGAGYSISRGGVSPMIQALHESGQNMTLIPVDYNHERTKSWLLLDAHKADDTDTIELEPVTADATKLPFEDSSIDGYLSCNLINEPRAFETEHEFVVRMSQEAYRVLKPGGFLIVSSFGYFWWKLNDGTVIYNDNIDIEEIVEKESVETILKKVGFASVQAVALSESDIEAAVAERLKQRMEKKGDVAAAGVRDACAFLAVK